MLLQAPRVEHYLMSLRELQFDQARQNEFERGNKVDSLKEAKKGVVASMHARYGISKCKKNRIEKSHEAVQYDVSIQRHSSTQSHPEIDVPSSCSIKLPLTTVNNLHQAPNDLCTGTPGCMFKRYSGPGIAPPP
jgi:hypothetical protein